MLAAASVLVFTALSVITFKQVSYWINSYVLFEHAADVTDNNWFAYNHLGIQYDHDGMELVRPDPTAGTQQLDTIAFALKKWNLDKPDPQSGGDSPRPFGGGIQEVDRHQAGLRFRQQ